MPIPFLPRTNSAFLCFFCIRNPHFRAFRAQNRGSCALFGFGTLVFGIFENKIGVFVRFLPPKPSFSGISSTKSGFLCFFGFGTLVFGHFEHKIGIFVLGSAFVFGKWWVLSCILTFVVCLSNFYELFLLKLLLRVCWSILAVALRP